MGTDWLEFIYLVCFFLGLGFAVLSALLAGVFGGHAGPHVDMGGAHVDLGSGHGHAGPMDGSVHFSPLSPVSLALFVTVFGGIGLLLKRSGMATIIQLPVAAVSGMLVGGFVSYLFYKIMQMTQGSSQPRAGEEIGIEAEVTVPIPNDGLGEVAYVLRGTRFTNPARTVDGKELPAHVVVKIVKQAGNTYLVQKT
jgi:membrane protein implicated in regulation of membrane protease activity